MKAILCSVLSLALVFGLSSSIAQTAGPPEAFMRLLKEVETQQAQITDNQLKIETKLNDISENVRVARIFGRRTD
jgi:hypothetical protein